MSAQALPRCLFAHGFEGSNAGSKPTYLQETLGLAVTAPVMYARGWRFSDQRETLKAALEADPSLELIVASSMGGLAAVAAAACYPTRPLSLILLAPAFGVHRLFERRAVAALGDQALAIWEKAGQLPYPHRGIGETVSLPWALYEECAEAASMSVTHPTVIIHGLQDDSIDPAESLALARRSSGVQRLIFCPDDHRLHQSFALIGEAIQLLFGTGRG